ncbi:MAG: S1C family serine protease, partial [Acidobacteria bacterium]|nr:S1C family serine protease [Acidobacteriota bacterium]
MKRIKVFNVCLVLFFLSGHGFAQDTLPTLVKRIRPGVTFIRTHDEKGEPLSEGSGFFIDKLGHLVTNRHVLEGASTAMVTILNGKQYNVKMVVAEDREGDLVMVSTDVPVTLVHDLRLTNVLPEIGQKVIAVGHPLGSEIGLTLHSLLARDSEMSHPSGLEPTISEGIVSSVRDTPGFGKVLQTTAPISHGSSGGPIINLKG